MPLVVTDHGRGPTTTSVGAWARVVAVKAMNLGELVAASVGAFSLAARRQRLDRRCRRRGSGRACTVPLLEADLAALDAGHAFATAMAPR